MGGERGDVTTTTLVFPVVLFTILVVVQFALAYHAKSVATAAAQDAARLIQQEGGTTDSGAARAQAFLDEHGASILDDVSITVDADADQVRVEVRGTVVDLVPGVDLRVSGVADGPRERFRPDGER